MAAQHTEQLQFTAWSGRRYFFRAFIGWSLFYIQLNGISPRKPNSWRHLRASVVAGREGLAFIEIGRLSQVRKQALLFSSDDA
ncbi:hypothetical protein [Pseudomonas sp.]|uniref:hypothetical protein n=1 Tax=Pseudomonas sp. TaxID=306 RepID=UPI0037C69616